MPSKNVQTGITCLFDAFNAHDLDAAMAGYADDVRFVSQSTGGVLIGPDAIHKVFEQLFKAFPDARADITRITDGGGDTVVYEFMFSGTQASTGKRFAVPCVDVVTFDAQGRIACEDNYSDRLSRLEQLGEAPVAATA